MSVLPVLAVLVFAGCDSEPHGPGTLEARVSGGGLGGVVLEVRGTGIIDFEGLGSTRVYAAPLTSVPNTHRVILIDPTGPELRFSMQVLDIGSGDVAMYVVSAVDTDNEPVLAGGIDAGVEGWSSR